MPGPSPRDQEALQKILAKSTTDESFRRALLTDPRRAIQQSLGIAVPPSFNMKFVEREPGVDALVVLPDFHHADGELSEDDLETIAGGADDGGSALWSDAFGSSGNPTW